MTKLKMSWKLWLLVIALLLSIISIFGMPPAILEKGVIVRSIDDSSTAYQSGLRQGDIIISLNNIEITSLDDYSKEIPKLFQSNESEKIVIGTKKQQIVFFTDSIPDITVSDIPNTKIKTGLDLEGGARALVKPEVRLNDQEIDDLISISSERLNVYGISDVSIRKSTDLSGENYMLIEIAGATPRDLEKLIGQQGKFEAKIGNETAFIGGNNDITHVCRDDATCSGVKSCNQYSEGFICDYAFDIYLSEEAAQRHADITSGLGINVSNPNYLDKQIEFYVDDQLTQSLFIHKNLKGQVTTQIQVSGSSQGETREDAIKIAESEMKTMQTILITGSLPYKLEIVKLDTISPVIGDRFNTMIFVTAFVAILAVSLIIFVRYRNFKASIALLAISFSEIIIILGVAAAIKWNLDLPSIVGILITIGTGVDQQIVILDESQSKRAESMKTKIKNALFIVFSAYATSFVALIPLWRAGAGLLRGFAVTTIIGLTIGVLITRPAFADIIKSSSKE
ncbi:hypothetical protein J4477_02170 [Candidatus Pacearchaeota archaeon]|nr:hypothetical protein [Candidatus Pacearchaeota archaeon]